MPAMNMNNEGTQVPEAWDSFMQIYPMLLHTGDGDQWNEQREKGGILVWRGDLFFNYCTTSPCISSK